MLVVLDTNVVVSGTFWIGPSFKVLELVNKDEITIIVTKQILEEYDQIVNSEEILGKTTLYQRARTKVLNQILNKSILVEPKENINIVKEDQKDNMFLEAAKEGNASFIITQDNHLLKIKSFENIKILKPEDFLKLIK